MRGPAGLTWFLCPGTVTSLSGVSLPSLCRDSSRPEQETLQALHGRLIRQLRRYQVRCGFLCQAPLVKDARMCRGSAGPPGMEPSDPLSFSPGVSTVTPCTWAALRKPPSSREPAPAAGSVLPEVWGRAGAHLWGPEGGGPGLCGGSSTDVRDDSGFHLICVSLFLLPLS